MTTASSPFPKPSDSVKSTRVHLADFMIRKLYHFRAAHENMIIVECVILIIVRKKLYRIVCNVGVISVLTSGERVFLGPCFGSVVGEL